MTKRRPPLSFESAITRVLAFLGDEEAARAVNRSASQVRRWSDPDDANLPTIDQALQLDMAFCKAGGDVAPIMEAYHHKIATLMNTPEVVGMRLQSESLKLSESLGSFSTALLAATAPDSESGSNISPNEAARIAAPVDNLRGHAQRILQFCDNLMRGTKN